MAKSAEDLLKTYRDKRDFSQTPEPSGEGATEPGRRFVVQKHDATRLHYDFRLEMDGVLKSWAVTKGPSLSPKDKRLAVQTEDHPLDYATFEGVIPSGYGEGTVMLWDEGTWEPQSDDPAGDLEKGQLKICLSGQRLKGGWVLVLMKSRSSKDKKNWLLIKERDEEADDEADLLEENSGSVRTGRDLGAIAGAQDVALPDFVEPQLATLADAPPEGEGWLHEIKYDGYRLQARKGGEAVQLTTRNGKNWTSKYPPVADALRHLKARSAVIDGEVVAVDEEGRSRFELLQNAGEGEATLVYYAFDLLHLDGEDLAGLPLTDRKKKLAALLGEKGEGVLQYSDHMEGEGGSVIGRACSLSLEGIISKKADAPYRSGRGRDWIKSKCIGRDEFVIGGYRRSDKKGRAFASLLVGEHEGGTFHYRGRVGTGFDEDTMAELAALFADRERKTPPFDELPSDARRDAVWLTPDLVAQVAYTERTKGGMLRHPSFLGLREDKDAAEVTTPKPRTVSDTVAGVSLSHPEKVLWDGQGVTKYDLARYYEEMAERILPFTRHRPMSLVRCPSGRSGQCFFQKHHGAAVPDAVDAVEIAEKDGEEKSYLVLNTPAALVAAAQIGALELHGWGARTDMLERPDRLVMDLDPDEGMDFADVKRAAMEVREVLESAGLQTFPMLTGGKGIHVIAPLERRRGWNDLKAAARGLARKLAEAAPDRYVAEASKKKREGRIFLDWLRNQRGATAVVPFSPRARPGAPVATPIGWDELSRIEAANAYTIETIGRRLSSLKSDPWAAYGETRQSITDGLLEFLGEA